MTWLAETPVSVVQACMAMLPRLEAQESLQAANRYKVGSGKLPKEQHDALAREWEQQAHAGRPKPKADPSVLAAHGFAIRRVKGKKRSKPPVPVTT